MNTPLTPRQAEMHGFPPTRNEICRALGFKSLNAAEEHLQTLARKGVGELELVMPAAAQLSQAGRWLTFAAVPHPYAPALAGRGRDLARVLMIDTTALGQQFNDAPHVDRQFNDAPHVDRQFNDAPHDTSSAASTD